MISIYTTQSQSGRGVSPLFYLLGGQSKDAQDPGTPHGATLARDVIVEENYLLFLLF